MGDFLHDDAAVLIILAVLFVFMMARDPNETHLSCMAAFFTIIVDMLALVALCKQSPKDTTEIIPLIGEI